MQPWTWSPSTHSEHIGEPEDQPSTVLVLPLLRKLIPTTWFPCSGAVLSLTMGENGDSCYSGGLDGTVRCWKMPDLNVDPYDNYGQSASRS